MEFFEVIKKRRSIRRYTKTPVPANVIGTALDAALIAPNSSNLQSWKFFWVKTQTNKEKLIDACLGQGAAKTAQELIVAVANPKAYKFTAPKIIQIYKENNAKKFIIDYYAKLVPLLYGYTLFSPIKYIIFNCIGLFRPIMRRPWSGRDVDEICIKSTALACENFMLAITAQGFDTCPMEGFDEKRIKKILKLSFYERVVMVISVGERDEKGLWGEQVRFSKDLFIKEI